MAERDSNPTLGRIKLLLFLVAVTLVVLSPYLFWLLQKPRPFRVVILDKTVPNNSYREHKGLSWFLNNQKLTQDGGKPYDPAHDYYGFFPLEDKKFKIKPLPKPLPKADMVYVADTYGVYTREYYREIDDGDFSRKIYGGLQASEAASIEECVRNGATLVAEYNAFATPTDRYTRERFSNLLSVRWTGWAGRYFLDMTKGVEVPVWAVRRWEAEFKKPWPFKGPGMLFAHESGDQLVLERHKDFQAGACHLAISDAGATFLGSKSDVTYNYWFDVLDLRPGAELLAKYDLDMTKEGLEKLRKKGIPEIFPAFVTGKRPGHPTYYFAGDYVDNNRIPRLYALAGLTWLKSWSTMDSYMNQDAVYWKFWVPAMKKIVAGTSGGRDLQASR
jgi:hypothetical protein